jgi:hypothetical protein
MSPPLAAALDHPNLPDEAKTLVTGSAPRSQSDRPFKASDSSLNFPPAQIIEPSCQPRVDENPQLAN